MKSAFKSAFLQARKYIDKKKKGLLPPNCISLVDTPSITTSVLHLLMPKALRSTSAYAIAKNLPQSAFRFSPWCLSTGGVRGAQVVR